MALIEKIEWSIPAGLSGVEILSTENSHHSWCIYHQTYSICNIDSFIEDEQAPRPEPAEWMYRRRKYFNLPGTLMLLEPGEIHRNTKDPHVNFSVALFARILWMGLRLKQV